MLHRWLLVKFVVTYLKKLQKSLKHILEILLSGVLLCKSLYLLCEYSQHLSRHKE